MASLGLLIRSNRTAWILGALMCLASAAAVLARPSAKLAHELAAIDLETMIPRQFGDWRESAIRAQVVNPQTQQTLDRLYDQILNRIYVNGQGYAVMLSIAYGSEQRGKLNVHRPENCYPAQGFQLKSIEAGELMTSLGPIPVRRLSTANGPRWEPVTYWVSVGGAVERDRLQRRLLDLSFGLAGKVPDGMLVRVSSIDRDDRRAFLEHRNFVDQLVRALPDEDRKRLSGLTSRVEAASSQ